MSDNKLGTESYKGVRDFYPNDMAVQRYIFDNWSKTAESFGFARYDASILEPAELYKAKGSENEELVNEQTYTFIDRGEREVTLRPEMTPTVARMVAKMRRELTFPVRWYSIPNLFRYERPQRGRLREHWQLNCDIFGGDEIAADIEMITLANQVLLDFGAAPEMFEIRINNRQLMMAYFYERFSIHEPHQFKQLSGVLDKKGKVAPEVFAGLLKEIVGDRFNELIVELDYSIEDFSNLITDEKQKSNLSHIKNSLAELGINNVVFDASLARGFTYYTGTIFEIFDVSGENNRAMLGGGRYDNLTAMFSEEPISGIGFGMGDVTMHDFLETHHLLPATAKTTAPALMIIPIDKDTNLASQKIAHFFRRNGIKVAVDIGNKKIGKKISDAVEQGSLFALVVGQDEITSQSFTLKNLDLETSESGSIEELLVTLNNHL